MTSAGRLEGKKWPASRTRRNSACGHTFSSSSPVSRACELSPYIARIGKRSRRSASSGSPSSPISSFSAEVLRIRRSHCAAVRLPPLAIERADQLLEPRRHRLAVELHPRHLGQEAIAEIRIAGVEGDAGLVEHGLHAGAVVPDLPGRAAGRRDVGIGEHQAGDSLGRDPRQVERDHAAEAVHEEVGAPDGEVVEQAFEIARQVRRACSRRPASRSGRGRAGRRA